MEVKGSGHGWDNIGDEAGDGGGGGWGGGGGAGGRCEGSTHVLCILALGLHGYMDNAFVVVKSILV